MDSDSSDNADATRDDSLSDAAMDDASSGDDATPALRSHSCSYPNCNMSFRTSSKMSRHYRTHDGERPFRCAYASCGKTYTRAEHLHRHELVHSGLRPHQCSQCPQAFRSSHHLKRHARTHESKLAFTCDACSAMFAKAFQLREHVFAHTGVKGFACDACPDEFVLKADLTKHRKKQHRERKSYDCHLCEGITFDKISERTRHLKELHADRLVCPICQKRFASNSRLNWHKKMHDPANHVPCPHCLKSYSTQANLLTHIHSVHDRVRAFVCDVESCRRAFALKGDLERHADRIHLNPKPRTKRQRQTFKTVLCGQDPSDVRTDRDGSV